MKLFDANGKEYEALTPEEVDAKVKAAVEETTTKFNEEKTQLEKSVQEAKDAAKKAADDLAAASDKDANFKALREAKEKAEKDLVAMQTQLDNTIKSAVAGVAATFVTKYKEELLAKLSQGDQKISDKMKVHLETTLKGMPLTNDKEVAAAMEAAYRLSVDVPKPTLINQILGAGNTSGGGGGNGGAADLDPEIVKWGAMFGLTPENIVKYTAKAKSNYNQSNERN